MLKPTVVIPAFDRPDSLRRALSSVQNQSCRDFECLIVDDGSTVDIKAIVAAMGDQRFRYLRREHNGGPYAARVTGYREMIGDFACNLDSDDELFPWSLDRARQYLEQTPSIDGVIGLHLRSEDSRLFVRIRDGERYVTPQDACEEPLIPDRVGMVRRTVVQGWLRKRDDYFAFEAHQWLTFALHHDQLYVDEPWILCHNDAPDRLTDQRTSQRRLDDLVKFLHEHHHYIANQRSVALDELVIRAYVSLRRAKRAEARLASEALRMRGLSPADAMVHRTRQKVKQAITRRRISDTTLWI